MDIVELDLTFTYGPFEINADITDVTSINGTIYIIIDTFNFTYLLNARTLMLLKLEITSIPGSSTIIRDSSALIYKQLEELVESNVVVDTVRDRAFMIVRKLPLGAGPIIYSSEVEFLYEVLGLKQVEYKHSTKTNNAGTKSAKGYKYVSKKDKEPKMLGSLMEFLIDRSGYEVYRKSIGYIPAGDSS